MVVITQTIYGEPKCSAYARSQRQELKVYRSLRTYILCIYEHIFPMAYDVVQEPNGLTHICDVITGQKLVD